MRKGRFLFLEQSKKLRFKKRKKQINKK